MLAGTVCCQDGADHTFDHCICQARKGQCEYNVPKLMAMQQSEDSRVGAGISASVLTGCARRYALGQLFDYHESPARYHARWRGNAFHALAERNGTISGVIQEQRFMRIISVPGLGDVEITGRPDWYDYENHYLEDWKSVDKVPATVKLDHIYQVNIYAWLLEGGTWTGPWDLKIDQIVESAAVRYIDMKQEQKIDVTLWTDAAVESLIIDRVNKLASFIKDKTVPDKGFAGTADEWKTRYCPFFGSGKCCADGGKGNGKG